MAQPTIIQTTSGNHLIGVGTMGCEAHRSISPFHATIGNAFVCRSGRSNGQAMRIERWAHSCPWSCHQYTRSLKSMGRCRSSVYSVIVGKHRLTRTEHRDHYLDTTSRVDVAAQWQSCSLCRRDAVVGLVSANEIMSSNKTWTQ